MSTLYNMGDLSKKFADKIKNSKSPIEQSKSIKEAAKTFKEANSFIMGGKKMVLDRGRYKEAGKTGSWSEKKAVPMGAVKGGVLGKFETPAQSKKRFDENEAKNKRYENAKANQSFGARVNQEYKSTPLQRASTGVKAVGQTVRATTNLAKEKARAALQKQGVPYRTNAKEKLASTVRSIQKFDRIKNEFGKIRKG